jgi:hypothetical protein
MRLRAQGLRAEVCGAGAELRVLLEAARQNGNVVYPFFNNALLAAPDAALWLGGAVGRIGFEIFFVAAVLLRRRDARLRIACGRHSAPLGGARSSDGKSSSLGLRFRVLALGFHQGVALCLAVDFVENKCGPAKAPRREMSPSLATYDVDRS